MWISAVLLPARTRFYTHIKAITEGHSIAEKFGVNVQRTWFIARARLAIRRLSCCAGDTGAGVRVALDYKYFDASKMGG